jgi:integrase
MPRKADWQASKTQFLWRNVHSGRYYLRVIRQGKEVWRALGTEDYQVAKAKLPEKLSEIHRTRDLERSLTSRSTFGEASELYVQKVKTDTGTKASTKDYWQECLRALYRSWPTLENSRLSNVTDQQCRNWATSYLASKRAPSPGTRTEPANTISASRFNNTLIVLRGVFAIGLEMGLISRNPACSVSRVRPKPKPVRIPSRVDFKRLVAEIRAGKGVVSPCCADLAEFLAYSGCRLDEARWIKWTDVDRDKGQIWIAGHEVTGTKSGHGRWVPIIPAMATLLDDMQASPRYPRADDRRAAGYVTAVRECQKAINRACRKLGVLRFSHHDLRHLFSTAAIESGADFRTVASWLGHRDGGALLARTYAAHLRFEHSQALAAKVTF